MADSSKRHGAASVGRQQHPAAGVVGGWVAMMRSATVAWWASSKASMRHRSQLLRTQLPCGLSPQRVPFFPLFLPHRSKGARVINTSFEMQTVNLALKNAIGAATAAGIFFAA